MKLHAIAKHKKLWSVRFWFIGLCFEVLNEINNWCVNFIME